MANNVTKYWVQSLIKKCFKSDSAKETLNTYSTDEQVIGTWIDGKPIYRKCYALSSSITLAKSTWVDTGISLGTIIIPIRGYVIVNEIAQSSYPVTVTNYASNNNLWIMYFRDPSQGIPATGYIVLEYTKTTD